MRATNITKHTKQVSLIKMRNKQKPNKSIKFAHTKRGLGLGDTARLAPYFERYMQKIL